ncbi:uncharacterized protein LOC100277055 [Zea mays]|nr:uncharacterized protein LOC100277055 [Zea mays]ONM09151.1 hypothetical protein ZEAMMB73_Zm00001d033995 [Zea mays]ONM09153.1 hypothetical protein ZEAMMB73_Zm00001d033995 [Zea mays]|eukprot:NP_001144195.2 uncharacterized protein LOC100277055 isoform 1 [Zea mays]
MILRRRSRSMNSSAGAQRSHVPGQSARSSTSPCDGDSGGAGDGAAAASSKSATARALFASPRLLHSSSLPAGTVAFAKSPAPDAEPQTAFSMSPTSVLDAAAAFVPGTDGAGKRRPPWRARDNNGLADALDCSDHHHQQQQQERIVLAATPSSCSLARSCSLDRRVEFGVKNRSSWLPLRGREATAPAPADPWEIEPSSEDYTCVISRGPNPRTVHIFGDRVVEGGAGAGADAAAEREDSSPRQINLPARGDRGFFSL